MPQQYAIEEVLEMAVQFERNGETFYTAAATHARHDATKKLLLEMAEWERRHEELFKQMADAMDDADRTAPVSPDGQAAAYLHAILAGKVSHLHDDAMQALAGQAALAMIFDMAIALEKEAILFYLGLREMVTTGKEIVDEVIEEERKHIRILTERSSLPE